MGDFSENMRNNTKIIIIPLDSILKYGTIVHNYFGTVPKERDLKVLSTLASPLQQT
jgi:hypothetical protein